MVQNYLGNMRRAVQRFNNFIDNRRRPDAAAGSQPRQSPAAELEQRRQTTGHIQRAGESIVGQLQDMTKRFREFTMQWSKTLAKQQSPLIDRIPPRGVELWHDFWNTVRKQVRRINEDFLQLTRDMGRVLTGRLPSTGSRIVVQPGGRDEDVQPANLLAELLYASVDSLKRDQSQDQVRQQFKEFYETLSLQLAREQQKMNELAKAGAAGQQEQQQLDQNLFDDSDDEVTRRELANNVALRQQIQQEINVFGSIFDIMRTFIARLRDSASTIRDILTPPGAINDNNLVTPGPSVKPTVDKLLEDTINAQRNINSQARPTTRD